MTLFEHVLCNMQSVFVEVIYGRGAEVLPEKSYAPAFAHVPRARYIGKGKFFAVMLIDEREHIPQRIGRVPLRRGGALGAQSYKRTKIAPYAHGKADRHDGRRGGTFGCVHLLYRAEQIGPVASRKHTEGTARDQR